LSVGVLGVGRRWRRRYAPALQALAEGFRISAVCDPVQERADREGRRLRCDVAAGPTELLSDESLDALLILEAPWYGLWPLELACRAGKPVFCAAGFDPQDDTTDGALRQAQECQAPVMMGTSLELLPAAVRLRELLNGPLGPPRLVLCDWAQAKRRPRRSSQATPRPGISGAVLDWCITLMGGRPTTVQVMDSTAADLASIMLEFEDGRAVHIVQRSGPGSAARIQVVAQRGRAEVRLPASVRWTDDTGRHTHRLPRQKSLTQVLLERFHCVILEGGKAVPGPEDARRTLAWLRAVARSRAEGRRVPMREE
jgi:predicted dehydrogenase